MQPGKGPAGRPPGCAGLEGGQYLLLHGPWASVHARKPGGVSVFTQALARSTTCCFSRPRTTAAPRRIWFLRASRQQVVHQLEIEPALLPAPAIPSTRAQSPCSGAWPCRLRPDGAACKPCWKLLELPSSPPRTKKRLVVNQQLRTRAAFHQAGQAASGPARPSASKP